MTKTPRELPAVGGPEIEGINFWERGQTVEILAGVKKKNIKPFPGGFVIKVGELFFVGSDKPYSGGAQSFAVVREEETTKFTQWFMAKSAAVMATGELISATEGMVTIDAKNWELPVNQFDIDGTEAQFLGINNRSAPTDRRRRAALRAYHIEANPQGVFAWVRRDEGPSGMPFMKHDVKLEVWQKQNEALRAVDWKLFSDREDYTVTAVYWHPAGAVVEQSFESGKRLMLDNKEELFAGACELVVQHPKGIIAQTKEGLYLNGQSLYKGVWDDWQACDGGVLVEQKGVWKSFCMPVAPGNSGPYR